MKVPAKEQSRRTKDTDNRADAEQAVDDTAEAVEGGVDQAADAAQEGLDQLAEGKLAKHFRQATSPFYLVKRSCCVLNCRNVAAF